MHYKKKQFLVPLSRRTVHECRHTPSQDWTPAESIIYDGTCTCTTGGASATVWGYSWLRRNWDQGPEKSFRIRIVWQADKIHNFKTKGKQFYKRPYFQQIFQKLPSFKKSFHLVVTSCIKFEVTKVKFLLKIFDKNSCRIPNRIWLPIPGRPGSEKKHFGSTTLQLGAPNTELSRMWIEDVSSYWVRYLFNFYFTDTFRYIYVGFNIPTFSDFK